MQTESHQVLITRLKGMIHECLKDLIPPEEPVAFLDFPDYRNCGDSAIWLGQMAYFREYHGKRPAYVSRNWDFSSIDLEKRAPSGPIFITGGGNFGDLWPHHQSFREGVLQKFKGRSVVQFPQSIHYTSPESIARTARIIGQHGNFTLLVRDDESLQLARKHFDCDVRLCPDMAFCIGEVKSHRPELPVFAILRKDVEAAAYPSLDSATDLPTEDWTTESSRLVRMSKAFGAASALLSLTPSELRLKKLDAAARNRFRRGVRHASRGRTLVTDRLHVHIFSLLMGKPHAVLDNSYGKIRRFMSAFSGGTDLCYQARSLEDGAALARERAKVEELRW